MARLNARIVNPDDNLITEATMSLAEWKQFMRLIDANDYQHPLRAYRDALKGIFAKYNQSLFEGVNAQ